MRKEDLQKLAENPDFISGIYNYCDRWCERCAFTKRCFLYATEQADPDLDDPEVRDITNEKFWRKLQSIFRATAEMIAESAREAGIDLEAIDASAEADEFRRDFDTAKRDELAQRAKHYAMDVEKWFREEFTDEEHLHENGAESAQTGMADISVRDVIEIIRWYQFFIAAKVTRALSSGRWDADFAADEDDDDDGVFSFDLGEDSDQMDDEEVIAASERIDAYGSAKVALVAIDRSLAAWGRLQSSLPHKSESIKAKLHELDGLRRSIETRFPKARDFIRPGLDEIDTEFVS